MFCKSKFFQALQVDYIVFRSFHFIKYILYLRKYVYSIGIFHHLIILGLPSFNVHVSQEKWNPSNFLKILLT